MLPADGVYGLGDVFEDEIQVELILFFALGGGGGVGSEGGWMSVKDRGRGKGYAVNASF